MFEQATIDSRGALKSPWALAVSITGQTLVLSAGIGFSLFHTDAIRPPDFLTIITAPRGPSAPPPPTEPHRSAPVRPTRTAFNPFVAPSRIPTKIDMTVEDPAPLSDPNIGTESGAILASTPFPNLMDSIVRPAIPQPRTEVVQPKKQEVVAPVRQISVSKGVQEAKLIRQVKPLYPQLARAARISGVVRLAAIIGKDGAIENLRVISGHPLLTGAAVNAVKQWLYQPTLLNGEPVDVITQIDVNFTLSQ